MMANIAKSTHSDLFVLSLQKYNSTPDSKEEMTETITGTDPEFQGGLT